MVDSGLLNIMQLRPRASVPRDRVDSTRIFLSLSLAVLEFELRAYTLSHSTSPFFVKGFSR
jgi:hypothetical protein